MALPVLPFSQSEVTSCAKQVHALVLCLLYTHFPPRDLQSLPIRAVVLEAIHGSFQGNKESEEGTQGASMRLMGFLKDPTQSHGHTMNLITSYYQLNPCYLFNEI
jgi:hypothetical protein